MRLSGVIADRALRRRLMELGFVRGRTIRILGRGPTGGLLVAVDDARIAIDHQICQTLRVGPVGAVA